MATRLNESERGKLETTVPGWAPTIDRDAIRQDFKFADFSAAWGFMTRVAMAAEKLDHHPDWGNTWNTVRIELSTHDVGGLSDKDVQLAQAINKILDNKILG